ncbi:MAG: zinc ribbon domain-containing protein, partial [Rubripirellula sp.]|nr:zinc ribbon domain-containing protein [Rubripirellula sp.]
MANGENAKYCGGCGQSLTENCANCEKPVYLTQTFCGDCGANLKELVEIRKQKLSDLLADAKKAASEYRYVEARQILNRITAISDYRFKRISEVANRTLNKVIDIEGKTETTVAEACNRASIAHEAGDNSEVIRCLEKIPDHLLDDKFQDLLKTTQSLSSEQDALEAELKQEINNKNWELVGSLVQQLLEIDPSHESAKRLAKKITQRLLESSKRSSKQGRYDRALEKLKCIPDCEKTDTIEEALSNATTDLWIWGELNSEPFASATLTQLASRLCDTYPENQFLNDVRKKLQQSLTAKPANRSHLNRWKAPNQSWMGGEANRLSRPENIRYQNNSGFEKQPGIFSVAIGLALQGLGRSRVGEDFLIRKKGLFSSGKKKSDIAWGLDIGTGSVKA